jgi:hypothetical protein
MGGVTPPGSREVAGSRGAAAGSGGVACAGGVAAGSGTPPPRSGHVGSALCPSLLERRYLVFGPGSDWPERFQSAARIGNVISHTYTTASRAARG